MREWTAYLAPVGQPLRVVRAASRVAWADLRTIYTPFTWSVGWLGRIIMQVVFFALIGTLLGSREAVLYLFVGQAVMATVVECFMAVPSTTWERTTGTLALLTAAPGPLWPVFVGRSLQWLPSGVATGSIVLLLVGQFFGVTWEPLAVPVVVLALAVVAVSMYAVALTLAALVLRGPRWRNVVSNIGHLTVMLICGVTVPTTIWSGWLQAAAQALPLTHGLDAVRLLESTGVTSEVWLLLGKALMLGAGWYALAAMAFTAFGAVGRRDGTIDFAE